MKPTLLSCTAGNDTIAFFSSLSAYAGPIPTVSVNVGFISGPCIHHLLFWLVSMATLHSRIDLGGLVASRSHLTKSHDDGGD